MPLIELRDLEAKLLLRTGGEDGADGTPAVKPLGDSGRLAVTVRGDESDEQLATLCAREAEVDVLLLEVRLPSIPSESVWHRTRLPTPRPSIAFG